MLPSMEEVQEEGRSLVASGFTTVATPQLHQKSKQYITDQQARLSAFESSLQSTPARLCSGKFKSTITSSDLTVIQEKMQGVPQDHCWAFLLKAGQDQTTERPRLWDGAQIHAAEMVKYVVGKETSIYATPAFSLQASCTKTSKITQMEVSNAGVQHGEERVLPEAHLIPTIKARPSGVVLRLFLANSQELQGHVRTYICSKAPTEASTISKTSWS